MHSETRVFAPSFAAPLAVLVLAAAVAASFARAADAPSAAGQPALDPKAIAALKSMGTHLRDLKSFTLHSDTTIDEVTDDGEKLQFGGTIDFTVRKPDRLRADINTDRRHRSYYYDGKTLTQYSPRMGYYATVTAPPTVRELVDVLRDRYEISLPLSDLFRWGSGPDDGRDLTAAAYVGPSKIGATECEHYAFRQPDVDWQVWIARGTELPCKLVITTVEEPTRPQYVAVFTWHPNVAIDDKTFVFEKPKTAQKIEIAVVDASAK
ncbi:MAG TPA: DUF2092 domain-containing protein [Rhodanobacteraceae bacterium]|nr:DUF2092 domain-containing protein [Rhodanobacteraceae bacterium]